MVPQFFIENKRTITFMYTVLCLVLNDVFPKTKSPWGQIQAKNENVSKCQKFYLKEIQINV